MPAMDILIASMAIIRDLILITKDEHFRDLKSLRKELKLKLWR